MQSESRAVASCRVVLQRLQATRDGQVVFAGAIDHAANVKLRFVQQHNVALDYSVETPANLCGAYGLS